MLRKLKFFYQRLTRGWDDSDTWAMDVTVSKFVLPRLKRYKEINIVDWSEYDKLEGCNVVDELIWFHEEHISDFLQFVDSDEARIRYERACMLWGKYYRHLWW